jgi:hypothetical protein
MAISAILFGVSNAVRKKKTFEQAVGWDLLFIFVLPFVGIGINLAFLARFLTERFAEPILADTSDQDED